MNRIIHVKKSLLKQFKKWLALNSAVEDAGYEEMLYKVTAVFPMGIEADIKLVNSSSGPYVDAVLFRDGCEIALLEPSYETFEGEYIFIVDGIEYVVEVK